jgi:hypothetical protein
MRSPKSLIAMDRLGNRKSITAAQCVESRGRPRADDLDLLKQGLQTKEESPRTRHERSIHEWLGTQRIAAAQKPPRNLCSEPRVAQFARMVGWQDESLKAKKTIPIDLARHSFERIDIAPRRRAIARDHERQRISTRPRNKCVAQGFTVVDIERHDSKPGLTLCPSRGSDESFHIDSLSHTEVEHHNHAALTLNRCLPHG